MARYHPQRATPSQVGNSTRRAGAAWVAKVVRFCQATGLPVRRKVNHDIVARKETRDNGLAWKACIVSVAEESRSYYQSRGNLGGGGAIRRQNNGLRCEKVSFAVTQLLEVINVGETVAKDTGYWRLRGR